jgi:iron complex outermembrane receptor protein
MMAKAIRCALVTLAGGAMSFPAHAQIEEIVVTAAKRQQTLQDIPIAVTVTQGEVLAQAQIQDILDLQSIVPSLRVTQLQTSTQTNFLIRGFGNGANNPGIEPAVGVFIDGVYRSRSASQIGDLLDIERIEVLRGPQSTLFGKNASAGIISIITQQPSRELGGHVNASLGNYNSRQLQGRVTGPVGQSAAFSLAGTWNQRDGYFRNLFTGDDINERDRVSVRGQLQLEPSDTQSWRFIADFSRIDEDCCGVVNLVDGPTGAAVRAVGGDIYTGDPFDRRAFMDRQPENRVDNGGVSATGEFVLGGLDLTSITSLRRQKAEFNYDTDFTSANLVPTNLNIQEVDTFTQELRLTSSGDGAIDWQVGGYFFKEDVEYANSIFYGNAFRPYVGALLGGGALLDGLEAALGIPPGTFFATGQGAAVAFEQDNTSYSLFAQGDWRMTQRATLTLGVAYLQDRKKIVATDNQTDVFSALNFVDIGFAQAFGALAGAPPTPGNIAANPVAAQTADFISVTPCSPANPPPACNQLLGLYPLQFIYPLETFDDGRSSDTRTNYTLRLAYELGNNLNLYGGVSTGYKSTSWNLSRDTRPFGGPDRSPLGGFDNPFYVRYGTRFARPEKASVYEIGLKGQWEKLAMNIAIFDQTIKDFQSNIFVGTGFVLDNAGKQSTEGVEIEVHYRPSQAWEVQFSGTFMNPKYDSFPGAQGITGPVDLSGQRPSGIHRQSISTAATWYWQAGQVDGFVRADYLYEDNVQVVENVAASIASRQVNMLNASVGGSINGWDMLLWGRNLTSNDYLISAFPSVAQAGSFSGYTNAPRTYGVTLRRAF